MKKILLSLLLFGFAIAKPIVSTSILPTKYFISQIAGDTLEVNVLVQKGGDPHTYEPKPSQIKMLGDSEIYFSVGVEFENTWLPRFVKNFRNLKVVKTDDGIKKLKLDDDHHHDHDHEDHDDDHKDENHHSHHHDGLDPHIWLDPILVKKQAKNILDALIVAFPEHKDLYVRNFKSFNKRLTNLDRYIKKQLKDVKDRDFIVYHPSWGYFAKRYDLDQIAIEVDGKEPKPSQLNEIIKEAKEENVKVIFVAPNFSKKAAKFIAKEIDAKVIEIDQLPLDWERSMKKTANVFAKSL